MKLKKGEENDLGRIISQERYIYTDRIVIRL
jgi:hypothetical protein